VHDCAAAGPGPHRIDVSVRDLGLGGFAVISNADELDFAPGTRFEDCRIELPDTGTLVSTLELRSAHQHTLSSGKKTKRTGFQFIDLPGNMLRLIQRYIMLLERERRSKGF